MEEMSVYVCVHAHMLAHGRVSIQGLISSHASRKKLEGRKQVPRRFLKRLGLRRLGNRKSHQPAEAGANVRCHPSSVSEADTEVGMVYGDRAEQAGHALCRFLRATAGEGGGDLGASRSPLSCHACSLPPSLSYTYVPVSFSVCGCTHGLCSQRGPLTLSHSAHSWQEYWRTGVPPVAQWVRNPTTVALGSLQRLRFETGPSTVKGSSVAAAAAWIQPLARELPCAKGAAIKVQQTNKRPRAHRQQRSTRMWSQSHAVERGPHECCTDMCAMIRTVASLVHSHVHTRGRECSSALPRPSPCTAF